MSIEYGSLNPELAQDMLDDICKELTGQTIAECDGDHAGTFFERDVWVSAEGIAQSLIEAYRAGIRYAVQRQAS